MNPLHLSGYGVKIKLRDMRSSSELEVVDGRDPWKIGAVKPAPMHFRPRRMPYDSIIVDGQSGYITLKALHWLSRNNVAVYVLNFDGSLISSILPPTPVKADLRAAQIRACADEGRKLAIAKGIVEAKVARSLQVLHWLAERYDIRKELSPVEREASKLDKGSTVVQVRGIEGGIAYRYWQVVRTIIPESFCFHGRMTTSHQNNASDPVNVLLNYGYAILEGECRRAINSVGLEPSVGFLHDFSDYQTKQSLVYDLQEPFRWLVDLTVIQVIEARAIDVKDFYFTADDYRYRFETEPKRRFIAMLRERFNGGVRYNGRILKWDTAIEQKAAELGRFLLGKATRLDFSEPSPALERTDSIELRKRILSLSQAKARRLGISQSTLHYLRKNSRAERPFKVYRKSREKLLYA